MEPISVTLCLPADLWQTARGLAVHEGNASAAVIRALEDYLPRAHRARLRGRPGKYQTMIGHLSTPVAALRFSSRIATCLQALHISYVYDLVALSVRDLRMRQNFGQHSQREVEEKLAALGLSLGMALDGATYADAVTAALIATLRAATHPPRTEFPGNPVP